MSKMFYKAALLALSTLPAFAMASHWSYAGEGDPDHWSQLSDEYKTCQQGMNQSPIDITHTMETHLQPLVTHYGTGPDIILNNGHTIQATVDPKADDSITLDGQHYTLQQFHFHAPSENTVRGKHSAMEMHLVHKNAAGEIAVVAVMFDVGQANSELDKLWKVMPEKAESDAVLKASPDINSLLPADRTYWRFSGSLTTPPCSEGVTWLVLKHPLTLSETQLEKFTHTMHHDNNRPTQPMHGRVVVE
ncbi:carbonic anhydrase [Scandinavium goeteborgense]|uniref:carbonic anhydrase n=1 Tax=Scandinavium goeteborgense TaxID=1851514 RepID=UPI000F678E50|nr:carbonic anhydrase family protein [Scandinavium goeteborgense]QKN80275.1 carbonic anhydrase family protein [Scandinavium goeteborgense]